MKITAKRVLDDDKERTHYRLKCNGHVWFAEKRPKGAMFDLHLPNGQVVAECKTLKACKQIVVKSESKADQQEVDKQIAERVDALHHTQPARTGSTWDCVDPCAWLVLIGEKVRYADAAFREGIQKTLDAMGWLDEHGKPDVAKANRELDRVGGDTRTIVQYSHITGEYLLKTPEHIEEVLASLPNQRTANVAEMMRRLLDGCKIAFGTDVWFQHRDHIQEGPYAKAQHHADRVQQDEGT